MWTVCLMTSILIFISGIIAAGIFNTRKSNNHSHRATEILFFCVFLSTVTLFLPVYSAMFDGEFGSAFKTVLLSIHNTIRVFIVDSEFGIITESTAHLSYWLHAFYSLFSAILYVMAPILTFGFVISFFKNISAYRKYIMHLHSDAYIFSELNEKSLALAASISQKERKSIFIFTDVFDKNEEQSYELLEKARGLRAICFKKDINTLNFKLHSKKSTISFFAIGENEAENINQALKIINIYNGRDHVKLFIFSTGIESELLLNMVPKGKVTVRRINEVQSLIVRNLYENGCDLFNHAIEDEGNKTIYAVVLGMGRHGTEMVKALSWFCQMDGYRVQIDAFDIAKNAESKFSALCPDLMSDRYNGVYVDGEAKYEINIHSEIDVNTKEFIDVIRSKKQTTYVFVALGNDEKNIKTAVNLRMVFEQMGIAPKIQAIIYDTSKKEALTCEKNKNQNYNIDFIGDLKTSYSENVIINSEIEKLGLRRHLLGCEDDRRGWKTDEFWKYEYNYRSSVSSAIHTCIRDKFILNIEGKKASELDENTAIIIEKTEHARWNAYMRSEGYIYKEKRNDLAKTHNCLKNYYELSEDIKRYDRLTFSDMAE